MAKIENLVQSMLNEEEHKTGSVEDTEIDIEDENEEKISVTADDELAELMNEQQVCDFATKLYYYEAKDKNEVFEGFLTNYFFNKKFLLTEFALLGADVAYSVIAKQPSQKILDLFLIENAALVGAGFAGKIVSYLQTRKILNKSFQYMTRSVLLKEQINEKVQELAEEQGVVPENSEEPQNAQNSSKSYDIPYFR